MREILYRGKRADNGEWVEGFYFSEAGHFIKERPSSVSANTYLVLPCTVGQYTGLKDRNGCRIFEGDIVQYAVIVRGTCLYIANLKIVFNRSAFCLEDTKTGHTYTLYNHDGKSTLEVIGNIHDKPELLSTNGR